MNAAQREALITSEAARRVVVDRVVRLLDWCDRHDVILADCVDEAEALFLEQLEETTHAQR